MRAECMNEECGWSGDVVDTVHFKHSPDWLLCPECHENVFLPDSEEDTKAEALRLRAAGQAPESQQ